MPLKSPLIKFAFAALFAGAAGVGLTFDRPASVSAQQAPPPCHEFMTISKGQSAVTCATVTDNSLTCAIKTVESCFIGPNTILPWGKIFNMRYACPSNGNYKATISVRTLNATSATQVDLSLFTLDGTVRGGRMTRTGTNTWTYTSRCEFSHSNDLVFASVSVTCGGEFKDFDLKLCCCGGASPCGGYVAGPFPACFNWHP